MDTDEGPLADWIPTIPPPSVSVSRAKSLRTFSMLSLSFSKTNASEIKTLLLEYHYYCFRRTSATSIVCLKKGDCNDPEWIVWILSYQEYYLQQGGCLWVSRAALWPSGNTVCSISEARKLNINVPLCMKLAGTVSEYFIKGQTAPQLCCHAQDGSQLQPYSCCYTAIQAWQWRDSFCSNKTFIQRRKNKQLYPL